MSGPDGEADLTVDSRTDSARLALGHESTLNSRHPGPQLSAQANKAAAWGTLLHVRAIQSGHDHGV